MQVSIYILLLACCLLAGGASLPPFLADGLPASLLHLGGTANLLSFFGVVLLPVAVVLLPPSLRVVVRCLSSLAGGAPLPWVVLLSPPPKGRR